MKKSLPVLYKYTAKGQEIWQSENIFVYLIYENRNL